MIVESPLPPHNLAFEEAVLGSVLAHGAVLDTLAPLLRPDDFYRERHGRIYAAALRLHERGQPVDSLTLVEELERLHVLADVGGPAFLSSLSAAQPTWVNAEYYARMVAAAAVRRRLITAAEEQVRLAYDESLDLERVLTQAEQALLAVHPHHMAERVQTLAEALADFDSQLQTRTEHRGVAGVPTGIPDLDRLLGGLMASDLVLVAGRPGSGKSLLGLAIVRHAAAKAGVPVVLFSLEMSTEQVAQRLVAAESGVDAHALRLGRLAGADWQRVTEAEGRLADTNVWLVDAPLLTVSALRGLVRRLHAQTPLGLVVVDYLQLLTGERNREGRAQEVAEISRTLKALAREVNVPVLALCQLNRAVEYRSGHRPQLADLRESGSLENDADVVVLVHREDLFRQPHEHDGLVELVLAKHRHGPVGATTLRFDGTTQRLYGLERGEEPKA